MAHIAANSGGDFSQWVAANTLPAVSAGNTVSTTDATTLADTFTVQIADWGVPTVTVPTSVAEKLSTPSPMSAVERMDQRLNRIRRRVAIAA